MTETIHAARSPEFLSRLYDGEADADERAAFESHRATCAECRRAADAFAASLAAFRSSLTAPAAPDLSARILRKLRAQSPSRRPFGVMFGIDIRWAGALVAALLVVLVAAPVLLRRPPAPPPGGPAAIPARILDAPAGREAEQAPAPAPRNDIGQTAPVPPSALARKDERPVAQADGPHLRTESGEGPADDEKRRFASAPKPAPDAAPVLRRQLAAAEASGGEAGTMSATEADALAPRLSVSPMDEQGPAPAVVSRPSDEQLAALRGREFVLIVETQGRVREAQPSTANGRVSTMKAAPVVTSQAPAPADLLRDLRFGPGDRPRRLLVRIE